jgi:magnesium and cobalt transporter
MNKLNLWTRWVRLNWRQLPRLMLVRIFGLDQPSATTHKLVSPSDTSEKELLDNMRDLVALTAADVMVPRADIVAIDIESPASEWLQLAADHPHSRFPVYRGTLDDVVGGLHIKDIVISVAQNKPLILADMVRDVLIISPALDVVSLLRQMRQRKIYLALVVDEYGGIDGMITLTDMMEAMVGDIRDEHVKENIPRLVARRDGTLLVDARYDLSDFEDTYGAFLTDDERAEADTFGGLAMMLAGRLPVRGELFHHTSGLEFEVLEADQRRVKRLRIVRMPVPPANMNSPNADKIVES